MIRTLKINRAPVLTLWATVVAQRLGYDRQAAVTLAKGASIMPASVEKYLQQKFGEALPEV